jgi:histone demethylase JARID1
LPTSSYGSGFPSKKGLTEDPQFDYVENLFNLNNVYLSPTSLLRVIQEKEEKISGISLPWMYVGMQFATFCWHVEDLFLNSVNYMHHGATKTWYIVPGHQK